MTSSTPPPALKPFLKWAGGKTRIVDRIRAALPPGRRLVEPFVGSATVFLHTDYPTALLADRNADLIRVYQQLRRDGDAFIARCAAYFTPENNTSARYYHWRAVFNATTDSAERAALFVYLNRHGFNGLCRYNAAGQWNVPFGRYPAPYFPAAEMATFAAQAARAVLVTGDFRTVLASAQRGDVVYCDPPYVPLSATAAFTHYTAAGFTRDDQQELATWARRLAARGIPVLVSNHDTPWTRELYGDAAVTSFSVGRSIAAHGDRRGPVPELLALFAPSVRR
jgi:DNA adenine methylase